MLASVVIPVYRDGRRALAAAEAIGGQRLPEGMRLEVVLVDDGSDDDTPRILAGAHPPWLRVLRLPANAGRSAARNAGARAAGGALVVFMDCDCLPLDADFVASHVRALRAGAVASTGAVVGDGGGFWDRYQREASARRQRQHAAGACYAGSSQNLAVRRDAFLQAGGFDTGFRHYGFEDRDLLLRLARHGAVSWAAATVRHMDRLALADVCNKMRECGAHSAALFAARHPEAYRRLGYAALDARLHPLRARVLGLLAPLVRAAPRLDPLLRADRVPYWFAKRVVRLASAVCYSEGTVRASRGGGAPA
jgi:GT2 family glycosyltransferase